MCKTGQLIPELHHHQITANRRTKAFPSHTGPIKGKRDETLTCVVFLSLGNAGVRRRDGTEAPNLELNLRQSLWIPLL